MTDMNKINFETVTFDLSQKCEWSSNGMGSFKDVTLTSLNGTQVKLRLSSSHDDDDFTLYEKTRNGLRWLWEFSPYWEQNAGPLAANQPPVAAVKNCKLTTRVTNPCRSDVQFEFTLDTF